MSERKGRRGFRRGEGHEGGPAGPDASLNDLTGNGIVNNGPEKELSGPGDTGADSDSDSGGSVTGSDSGGGADGEPGAERGEDSRSDLNGDLTGGLGADVHGDVHGGSGASGGLRGLSSLGGGSGGGPDGDLSELFDDFDDGDELALRRLMRGAVADLRPSDGALDQLRKAVPARRARKRQAIVGMAAAALLIGTAVPAFVHVANSGGTSDDHPVNAGHRQEAQGGTDADKPGDGAARDKDRPSDKVSAEENDPGKKDKKDDPESEASGGEKGDSSKPADSYTASSGSCGAGQLAISAAEAGAPDSGGTVYGTFRIANVSGADCSVTGRGTVGFQALGAADQARITVVAHTPGDAAAGLPDPSQESTALVLPPNGAYEVKFAWVPADSCPTTGASPDPSPTDDGASGGTSAGPDTGTGSGSDGSGAETQLRDDGGTADGSVSVSHTPEAGQPTAQATIPNACAGTIYRTGILAAT
ncbi:hypothetical protein [Streptomyces sp. NPDC088400]|uniref:hypothetical protein n=1 Tax=Streptomyces sp. NPDC088400 TaxID=3365861 RepID=UPI0037FBDB37